MRFFSASGLSDQRIEQKISDVVGQRAADEELHRKVVEALGIAWVVGLLGEHPSLRKDVPHRAGKGLEPVARRGRGGVHRIVEEQMTFIECIFRAGELYRAASVPVEELL